MISLKSNPIGSMIAEQGASGRIASNPSWIKDVANSALDSGTAVNENQKERHAVR